MRYLYNRISKSITGVNKEDKKVKLEEEDSRSFKISKSLILPGPLINSYVKKMHERAERREEQ